MVTETEQPQQGPPENMPIASTNGVMPVPLDETTVEPQPPHEPEYIQEGQARIAVNSDVFYNNVQEFNRDLSIAVISTWLQYDPTQSQPSKTAKKSPFRKSADARRGTILEALSATGLRSLRYAKEIPSVGLITANDMDASAVQAIKHNMALNDIRDTMMKVSHSDANQVMYEALLAKKPYSIVDLDPFGTASPFIDAAVQAVASGGLLCVTCTDMSVLCGNHTEVCFEKYGGTAIAGTPFCHEAALRLVLHSIQSSAARYKRCIVPLLSMSIDFYCRVFVAVYDSPAQTKFAASNTILMYVCMECKSFETQRLGKAISMPNNTWKFGAASGPTVPQKCVHCDSNYHVGGPLYAGKLYEELFVQQLLGYLKERGVAERYKTHARMFGMLTVVSEELSDELFYYEVPRLSSSVKSSTPPHPAFCSALLNAGYQVSSSHASRNSVKTNAPSHIVWDVMRAWVKAHPLAKTPAENSIAAKILSKEPSIEVSFAHHPLSEPPSRKFKLVRFEIPPPNSGPKARPAKAAKRKNEGNNPQQGNKKKKQKRAESGFNSTAAATPSEAQESPEETVGGAERQQHDAMNGDPANDEDVNGHMEVDEP
ncbi:hypothetical protein SeLEV6574_g05168 [Synchytrium endobioticum]|uniref:tRNA (guanine(26)-N(2))-dimethyltransferase n=1 Tax=Synchytrium endobioticum TaxID=286115 RepID=A0A507CVI8_9FUNG|nr:hypothetical protein SeLEV6574_g08083 [Synchytrium endobioticum]TPX43232.1 hypothetical protein SeLEV6574_g05168 [Synchytrium endobioticum]